MLDLHQINRNLRPRKNRLKEHFLMMKYLRWGKRDRQRGIGVMRVDGRVYHGGLNDRFKGAVSWWNYCQERGLEYKLLYTYPFDLTDYVVPNKYDWRINESEIPDSIFDTRIFFGRAENGRRLAKLKTRKNIWYYGNLDISLGLDYPPYNTPWGEIFNYLFKPSERVQQELDKLKLKIGSKYVAAVYRFQNLLGDFAEYKYKSIEDSEQRNQLINRALQELEKVHEQNPDMRVLVTSDSLTFLEKAIGLPYVFVIPGDMEHMDSTQVGEQNKYQYLKSFLDYFMIAGAEKTYSIVIGKMYRSEFPEYAAKINNHPFIRIRKR